LDFGGTAKSIASNNDDSSVDLINFQPQTPREAKDLYDMLLDYHDFNESELEKLVFAYFAMCQSLCRTLSFRKIQLKSLEDGSLLDPATFINAFGEILFNSISRLLIVDKTD